jgi:hypothetical protein
MALLKLLAGTQAASFGVSTLRTATASPACLLFLFSLHLKPNYILYAKQAKSSW